MEPAAARPQQQRLAVWAGRAELRVGPAGTHVAGTHVSSTRRQWHVVTLLESFIQEKKVSVSSFIASFPSFHFSQMPSLTCD